MGLDVYVGSLTRYSLGDWETIVQQLGRAQGLQVEVERPAAPSQGLIRRLLARIPLFRTTGPEDVARAVERWRQALGRVSGLGDSFRWNDDPGYEYFTDKPAWDCYGGLVIWASLEQLPHARRAETSADWSNDPAYREALRLPDNRYPHLVADTEIWFPVEFDRPFAATSLLDEPLRVGSSIRLLRELDELNARTWRATAETVARWRMDGAEHGGPLEQSAQFGFAVFHALASLSVQHRLPMKLDY